MEFKGTKDLAYYKANAKEDYMTTPISVLRYIQELEQQKAPEMLEELKFAVRVLKDVHSVGASTPMLERWEKLIKEATEI
jgi:CMP-2-keto-3-deoxyoctulosonic acid synthetase